MKRLLSIYASTVLDIKISRHFSIDCMVIKQIYSSKDNALNFKFIYK